MKRYISLISVLVFSFLIGINFVSAKENIIKTETKDKILFISDNGSEFLYSWTFDKNEYKKSEDEFDLRIKYNSPNKEKIDALIDENMKKEYVSFNHHGELPGVATIKVPITKFKDGDRLNLYYYDDTTNEIKQIKTNVKVMNGYVTFDIEHCSDYFLTLSIVKEASNTNNNGIVIIGMLIVIVGLVGYTIFKNKK